MIIHNKDYFYNKVLVDNKRTKLKKVIDNKKRFYSNGETYTNNKVRKIKILNEDTPLTYLQNNLKVNFLDKIILPDNICGFIKDKNYTEYLQPHLITSKENRYYLRLDIKSFFDSITNLLILRELTDFIQIGDENEKSIILSDIIEIVTYNQSLPQGAITSPGISNLVFRRIDLRIRNYCRKLNITYTRYADDMLFSSSKNRRWESKLIRFIKYILNDYKLKLNYKKIIKSKNHISLNGFVVDQEIRLSRKRLYELRKILFLLEQKNRFNCAESILDQVNSAAPFRKWDKIHSMKHLHNYLAGHRAFLISLIPHEDNKWRRTCFRLIDRIQNIIIDYKHY